LVKNDGCSDIYAETNYPIAKTAKRNAYIFMDKIKPFYQDQTLPADVVSAVIGAAALQTAIDFDARILKRLRIRQMIAAVD